MTRLRDMPLKRWIPAANVCRWCGARYQVRLRRVERGSWWGEAEVRAPHRAGCVNYTDEGRQTIGWHPSGQVVASRGRDWPLLRLIAPATVRWGRPVSLVAALLLTNSVPRTDSASAEISWHATTGPNKRDC